MRRSRVAAAMCMLVLAAGCAAQPPGNSQPEEGEIALVPVYEALGETYPMTQPIIVACDYFRLVGERERRPLGQLPDFNKRPDDIYELSKPVEWSQRACERRR